MKPKLTKAALLSMKPCEDSQKFIQKHGALRVMWFKCERADWMVWALRKFGLLDDRTARQFAMICADHTLHFFEDKYPEDKRPRLAIEAARRCIDGQSPEAIAAWAAAGAAGAAENKWQADQLRKLINPFGKPISPRLKLLK